MSNVDKNKAGYPGRKLRVLHIGNIANNGFMASSILNDRGIESHLLVMDYYHIGGCPEWESAEVEGDWGNDFYPALHNVNVHGYRRPDWIAQGPRYMAMQYLVALNQRKFFKKWFLRFMLALVRRAISTPRLAPRFYKVFYSRIAHKIRRMTGFDYAGFPPKPPKPPFPGAEWVQPIKSSQRLASLIEPIVVRPYSAATKSDFAKKIAELSALIPEKNPGAEWESQIREKRELEAKLKPPRVIDETLFADFDAHKWKGLFEYYDVVVGYATDGVYPLMVGKPYMAFEHGTIRKIPFDNTYVGRQTAAVYKNAGGVFITNCDNIIAAKKLELKNYTFIPHPTREQFIQEQKDKGAVLRKKLEDTFDCDFIVFSPCRHHWEPENRDSNWDKGNDLLIIGFASLLKKYSVRGLLILVDAGQTVHKSKALIASLGIGSRILWIKTQPHFSYMRYLFATDVVADQFGHKLSFGGIPPKAMQCSVPIVTLFDPKLLTWCFSEMPPFLNPGTPDAICSTLFDLYKNPEKRKELGERGKEWYSKYYSNDVFFEAFAAMTKKALGVDLKAAQKN